MGKEEAAYNYLAKLQHKIDFIIDGLRRTRALQKRVMMMEWIEPIYNCGHCIHHQVAFAGVIDMIGNPGGDSIVTPWNKVVKHDHEVLVIVPCSFQVKHTLEEFPLLTKR